MNDDLNSVKKPEEGERSYHHGALRPALLAAAEQVIAERGLDGFSLRETARRAGVSPSAPAHHFGDSRGLLTALATSAFRELGDALEAASTGGEREERIKRQGIAYVRFALAAGARFDLMWRAALLDRDDPDYAAAAGRAFQLLDKAVRGEEAEARGPSDPAVAPSIACWALVHGFARLAIDGAFGTDPETPELVARHLLPQVMQHLTA